MKALVTGSEGFIGKNLVVALGRIEGLAVAGYDLGSDPRELAEGLATCDFVFHLAGVNRPEREEEYVEGNAGLTARLCSMLRETGRRPGFLLASSTQAALDNPYGVSKKLAEDELFRFARESGAEAWVFRLPGIFGKWSRPNYNTVVATFCHNVARDMPIAVADPERELELAYVDDVVTAFLAAMRGEAVRDEAGFCRVAPVHKVLLGDLAGRIRSFRESRDSLVLPDLSDPLTRALHATYLSFVPEDSLRRPLALKADDRGSLAEVLKSLAHEQVMVGHVLHPIPIRVEAQPDDATYEEILRELERGGRTGDDLARWTASATPRPTAFRCPSSKLLTKRAGSWSAAPSPPRAASNSAIVAARIGKLCLQVVMVAFLCGEVAPGAGVASVPG